MQRSPFASSVKSRQGFTFPHNEKSSFPLVNFPTLSFRHLVHTQQQVADSCSEFIIDMWCTNFHTILGFHPSSRLLQILIPLATQSITSIDCLGSTLHMQQHVQIHEQNNLETAPESSFHYSPLSLCMLPRSTSLAHM